ncbi:putative asparagine synthase [Ascoidea rubescens DSM 1968]|uniref:Adenine nucleotide alpha hydrolases-like protein n=1 Tax=Ascoidea rubescens DSM 1968 TaxID=1344418 RepID=A0A1D2VND6_9ASCO|nr:adenine nucleotide alpha hydrolases-like protein [Ascoidea rubescens DSM 1968]ODV63087.1 adenine nucleotide alpha hydrolases-like protein [Ascoidea rubescens DSM 1968]
MCGILLSYVQETRKVKKRDSPDTFVELCDEQEIAGIINEDFRQDLLAGASSDRQFKTEDHIVGALIPRILSRGPNYGSMLAKNIKNADNLYGRLTFFSSILSLRSPFTKQPLVNGQFVLQFNGELYNTELVDSDLKQYSNDTLFFMSQLLSNCQKIDVNHTKYQESILFTISAMDGEFAYSIYDSFNKRLYFGRDSVGKRSLMFTICSKTKKIYLSSLPPICKCHGSLNYQNIENINDGLDDYKLSKLNGQWVDCERGIIYCFDLSSFSLKFNKDTNFGAVQTTTNSSFAILFSGGIDCTIIAALCAFQLVSSKDFSEKSKTIDLLNVGFDNPRTRKQASAVPDRQLALKSWFELCKIYGPVGVEFNLIEIDISYKEYIEGKKRVLKLIWPEQSVMDLSISIAFFFASRGLGSKVILDQEKMTLDSKSIEFGELKRESNFNSNCKVLLSGLGADELFGGYSRHEGVFNDYYKLLRANIKNNGSHDCEEVEKMRISSYRSLEEELLLDISRIWKRNLGRDDKVICSWGKELRYPFLCNDIIDFSLKKIPLNYKKKREKKQSKNGQLPKLIKKYFLRKVAVSLDLEFVSEEPKRAIQFGARSARMDK